VKLPPLKLPPKPVPATSTLSTGGETAREAGSPPSAVPSSLKPPMPPMPGAVHPVAGSAVPPVALAPLRPHSGLKPTGVASALPAKPPIPVMASPAPSAAPAALRPEPVAQPASAKPMPQATIKLQVAPKPAAAATRKSEGEAAVTPADHSIKKMETAGDKPAPKTAGIAIDEEPSKPEVPLLIAIAAAALALVAFAVQAWTFIS